MNEDELERLIAAANLMGALRDSLRRGEPIWASDFGDDPEQLAKGLRQLWDDRNAAATPLGQFVEGLKQGAPFEPSTAMKIAALPADPRFPGEDLVAIMPGVAVPRAALLDLLCPAEADTLEGKHGQ